MKKSDEKSVKHVKISVITPVYNGEKYIESCIKNVIDQKCPHAEHIIVDGGSKDGTVEVIKKYAKKYKHIRWISEKDKGQSDAMNKGIEMARGSIIGFLNVDDFYEKNTLNTILKTFKKLPEPSFLVGNCNILEDNFKLYFANEPKNLDLFYLLKSGDWRNFPLNPSAYFYHKSLHKIIGFYDVNENFTLDIDFVLRALHKANCVYLNKTFGNWLKTTQSKTVKDIESNFAHIRFKATLFKYWRFLPLCNRLILWMLHPNYAICGILYNNRAHMPKIIKENKYKIINKIRWVKKLIIR
jgi:glycosyltransferase involved in cell wall biosynthesis